MTERTGIAGDKEPLPDLDESAYAEDAQELPEHDPRTDGVGDGGELELPALSDEEIAEALTYDQQHRRHTLAEQGEPE
jgi:hypothetical protein